MLPSLSLCVPNRQPLTASTSRPRRAGRDGCPQPSVRGPTHAPRSTSSSLWQTGRGSTACCPSCLSALGRDGCPQPSVRRPTHAPRSSSSSLTVKQVVAAPRAALVASLPWVGTAVPSRPFADQRTHLDRVPLLSLVNGGLGTTRPTLRPLHKNKEPRTKNAPALTCLAAVPSCPRLRPLSPCHHAHVSPRRLRLRT